METKTKQKEKITDKRRVSITKVPGLTQPEVTVECRAHGQLMNRVGRSERGLPLYYCEKGCVAEVGVSRVKRVFEEHRYGFIYKKGEDMFFHFNNLVDFESITRGDLVVYQVGYNKRKKRLQAVKVRSLNGLRG